MPRILLIATFIVVLLAVVIGGHLYLAHELVVAPMLDEPWRMLALCVIAAGAAALILQPIAERALPRRAALWFAWPASLWMGFAFMLLLATLSANLVQLLMGAAAGELIGARVSAVVIVGAALAAGVKGVRGALAGPQLVRHELRLPRWPAALDGFRIVQISDIHIGPILDRRFAASITERCNALAPDLTVVTGDLVDGEVHHVGDEVEPFAGLHARHGVYFVTGNHDYLSGVDPWVRRVEELGLRPLRNQHVTIEQDGASFDLAGVEDHHAHLIQSRYREDVDAALAGRDRSRALVLLAHDPLTFKRASAAGVDLQLSGHTHGGQIWPFRYLVRLSTPFVAGHYEVNGAQLYVSRGTGFWGPIMRLWAPAEITELTLRRA